MSSGYQIQFTVLYTIINTSSMTITTHHHYHTITTLCGHTLYSQDTFTTAKSWVTELRSQASPNIVIALSGNKADLVNKRVVGFKVCQVSDASTKCV